MAASIKDEENTNPKTPHNGYSVIGECGLAEKESENSSGRTGTRRRLGAVVQVI
jgi:hypothetical protein